VSETKYIAEAINKTNCLKFRIDLDELIRRNEHRIENDPSGEENDGVSSSTSSSQVNTGRRKTYKRMEELTPEARVLHDELPDLSYMLSDRLIFPALDAVGGQGDSKG